MKIAVVSLGCPKNQVDADVYTRALLEAGHATVPDPRLADAVLINTCGFIESAKLEAIETILEVCRLKEETPALKVVVTGCLAERYRRQVETELPEVDAVVGIGKNWDLPAILEELAAVKASALPRGYYAGKENLPLDKPRVISTPPHYAWLKIAEGCGNRCAYCAIPLIRGPLRSRPEESVLREAEWLAGQGVRELVLVAQDVTAYGLDRGEAALAPLLKKLDRVEGLRWIRLLYAYPDKIDRPLLETIRGSEKILPYIDLPVQHCDEEVLGAMGRRGGAAAVERAIALVREVLPGATLRTSVIAGFPGETQRQFEKLCDFVKRTEFDRLGCFAYSPEEDTPAERLPGQLPQQEREQRADIIMRLQCGIMEKKQAHMVGSTIEVVCDGADEDTGQWLCRSRADAPEIDANVLVDAGAGLVPGEFYRVRVTGTDGIDLLARAEGPDGGPQKTDETRVPR